jgi:hypothetical protein
MTAHNDLPPASDAPAPNSQPTLNSVEFDSSADAPAPPRQLIVIDPFREETFGAASPAPEATPPRCPKCQHAEHAGHLCDEELSPHAGRTYCDCEPPAAPTPEASAPRCVNCGAPESAHPVQLSHDGFCARFQAEATAPREYDGECSLHMDKPVASCRVCYPRPAREASTAPGEETKWLDTVGAQRFLEEAAEACDLGKNPMIEAAEFRKLAATVAALTAERGERES